MLSRKLKVSREDIPLLVSAVCLVILILGGVFTVGVVAQRKNIPPAPQLISVFQTLKGLFSEGEKDPLYEHLQPARGQGAGVVVNERPDDNALILLLGFFDNQTEARLIRRDGSVVKKWPLVYSEHFPDQNARVCDLATDLNVDAHGVVLSPDGELVFNYEYCGTVKLDRCGKVLWTVNKRTHHTVVAAEAGGYWLAGRDLWWAKDDPDRLPPFSQTEENYEIGEDTILRLSEGGEVLEEYSVPALLRENGLEPLLTSNVRILPRPELVHVNKVAELSSEMSASFPLFKAGDLLVSLRNMNLVMVIDPATKRVKWKQVGPWLRQHDPEFRPDGKISIFDNNGYRTGYDSHGQTILDRPHVTNIIAVDPATHETETLYGLKPGQEMLSVVRGQHEILENGGMLITEFDAGRVFEVDASGNILWSYVNQYDEDHVGEITNAVLYRPGYFKTDWASCQ